MISACSSFISDGTEYDYEYDDNGNPTRIWGAYNVRIDNEYDSVIKTNIKKQIVSNVDESKKIVTSKEYNSSFNNVAKEKDELENETCYEYNALGKVKKIIDATTRQRLFFGKSLTQKNFSDYNEKGKSWFELVRL